MLADGKLLALVGTPAQVAEALLGIGIYGASAQLQQQWQPQEAQRAKPFFQPFDSAAEKRHMPQREEASRGDAAAEENARMPERFVRLLPRQRSREPSGSTSATQKETLKKEKTTTPSPPVMRPPSWPAPSPPVM